MPLVDYPPSDSDPESEDHTKQTPPEPSSKRRKLSSSSKRTSATEELPPLPPSFRDVYSSTIRTSTQDDPSLHGGRKRVTPHVQGNWPAHVFLDWQPSSKESDQLNALLERLQTSPLRNDAKEMKSSVVAGEAKGAFHSLLHSELGVPLPLHVSLSRPLALKTEDKDAFPDSLRRAVKDTAVRAFAVSPNGLSWHPNELGTRWFLVMKLQHLDSGDQLVQLLKASNDVAERFQQPQLYAAQRPDASRQIPDNAVHQEASANTPIESTTSADRGEQEQFHVSLAWALNAPEKPQVLERVGLVDNVKDLQISFNEVKVRIGQDVHTIPLRPRRQSQRSLGLT